MKHVAAILSAAFLLAMSAPGQAQSLADIAKKERERREEIKQKSDVITNEDVSEYEGGAVSTVTPIEIPSDDTESGEEEKSADSSGKEKKTDSDEPVDLKGRTESDWHEMMSEARRKVQELENEKNVLILQMNDLQNRFYNMDDGFDRDDLQVKIQETYDKQEENNKALDEAREELSDLEKEAKSSGALPGWLE